MAERDLASVTGHEKQVYDYLVARVAREPEVRRLVLFGSRARGDHHERSDFDLAIEVNGMSDEAWARLALELRENAPTLCGVDLVRLDGGISTDLLARIRQEGIDLYVKR